MTWSDTQVVAVVAGSALTGIARVQQNGAWSNAVAFTVPGGNNMQLLPSLLNMVVGDTHTVQALSAVGQPVTGLTWTSSDPTVVSLSTDDPPVLTAVAAGHVTIAAGTASADVTVSAGSLPLGTVLWSNPGNGSGVSQIVPAVPSSSGVADVFGFQNDGTVQAITIDGTTAWTADLGCPATGSGPQYPVVPDFQGGLVAMQGDCTNPPVSLVKFDGLTGQAGSTYIPAAPWAFYRGMLASTDGTIFAVLRHGQESYVPSVYQVVGIDPAAGIQKFAFPLSPSSFDTQLTTVSNPIIAGDGYAYVPYANMGGAGGNAINYGLRVLRVNGSGASDDIPILEFQGPASELPPPLYANVLTNADTGIVLTWIGAGQQKMALTNGTSVTVMSGPALGDPSASVVAPVLQAQDGSFVGVAQVGYSNPPTPYMVSVDASGNVRWVVPNEQPKIATADGGVIGQSGITYDQNGSATGQVGSLPTYSWLGNAYQYGSTDRTQANPPYVATGFWPFAFANASANATSVREDWFPPLDHCTSAPGCIGHYEAIYNALQDLLTRLSDSNLSQLAQTLIFNKIGNDSSGNKITTASFIRYLTVTKPGFYDGTRSGYCYEALTPQDDNAFCNWWIINRTIAQSIGDYLYSHPGAGAVTGTPSNKTPGNMLRVFFRPSFILYNSLGKNLGNEGTIFHEALHGISGQYDAQILQEFGVSQPSCMITTYIQSNVLSQSSGLDSTVTSCP